MGTNYISFIVFGLLFFISLTSSQTPLSTCFASRSTWFADNQHGACMYGTSLGPTGPGNYLIAASSKLVFNHSADCGACYQITGPNTTSVIVMVVDECTDGGVCNTTFPHLDLAPQAFNYLQNPSLAGVTDTQVRRVSCPLSGGLKLIVGTDFFSSTEWEIMIFNHVTLIRQVSITYPGQTTPLYLPRQTYNYWRYGGPPVTYPITVSVTDIYGSVVSFQPITFTSGLIVQSTASPSQFPVPQTYANSASECSPPLGYNSDGWIYTDELTKEYNDPALAYINTFQWSDWSYGSTINWAYTQNPYAGSDCVQASIQGRAGIQIGRSTGFAWANVFTSLQFAIRGDIAFSGISVFWKGSPVQVPVSVTTSWQLITLSLSSDLQTPSLIGDQTVLVFQNTLGNIAPNIYLDNIRLVPLNASSSGVPSSSTPPSSTTSSTTGSSTTTSTTTTGSNSTPSSTTSSTTGSSHHHASTTTTTTGSNSTPSSTTGSSSSSACPLSLTQVKTGTWTAGSTTYTQWTVTLTNLPQNHRVLTFIDMSPAQANAITQFWSVTQSNGNFEFPSWVVANGGLSPSQSLNWGYVTQGSTSVNFSLLNAKCS